MQGLCTYPGLSIGALDHEILSFWKWRDCMHILAFRSYYLIMNFYSFYSARWHSAIGVMMNNYETTVFVGRCTKHAFWSVSQVNCGYVGLAQSSFHHRFFSVQVNCGYACLAQSSFYHRFFSVQVIEVNSGHDSLAESSLDHDFDPSFDVTFDHGRTDGIVPLSAADDFRRALFAIRQCL